MHSTRSEQLLVTAGAQPIFDGQPSEPGNSERDEPLSNLQSDAFECNSALVADTRVLCSSRRLRARWSPSTLNRDRKEFAESLNAGSGYGLRRACRDRWVTDGRTGVRGRGRLRGSWHRLRSTHSTAPRQEAKKPAARAGFWSIASGPRLVQSAPLLPPCQGQRGQADEHQCIGFGLRDRGGGDVTVSNVHRRESCCLLVLSELESIAAGVVDILKS